MLVYHSATQNRQFVGVYIPSTQTIATFTVSSNKINKALTNLELKFKKTLDEYEAEDLVIFDKFTYSHHNDIKVVLKQVDSMIKEFKNKNKTSHIVVVHSQIPVDRLITNGLSTLNGEVPYMLSSTTAEENHFPALEWSYFATSKFCLKCCSLSEWFEEKMSFSNYAEIPLGNLEGDTALQMIDVLYSRALQKQNYVLWYSNTTLPDLGGNEDIDYRRFYDQFDSNTEMSFPGFYRSYCVEIDVSLL